MTEHTKQRKENIEIWTTVRLRLVLQNTYSSRSFAILARFWACFSAASTTGSLAAALEIWLTFLVTSFLAPSSCAARRSYSYSGVGRTGNAIYLKSEHEQKSMDRYQLGRQVGACACSSRIRHAIFITTQLRDVTTLLWRCLKVKNFGAAVPFCCQWAFSLNPGPSSARFSPCPSGPSPYPAPFSALWHVSAESTLSL